MHVEVSPLSTVNHANPSCAEQTFASFYKSIIVSLPNDVVDLSAPTAHDLKTTCLYKYSFFKLWENMNMNQATNEVKVQTLFFCTDTLSDVSLPVYPTNQGAFCNSLRWLSASSQHERRKPPSARSY